MRCHTSQTAAHAHTKGHMSQPAGTYPQDPHALTHRHPVRCGAAGPATVQAAAVTLVVLRDKALLSAESWEVVTLVRRLPLPLRHPHNPSLSAAKDAAIPELGYLTKWQLSSLRNDQPECTRSHASNPRSGPPFSQNCRRHGAHPRATAHQLQRCRVPAPASLALTPQQNTAKDITAPQKGGTRISATAT